MPSLLPRHALPLQRAGGSMLSQLPAMPLPELVSAVPPAPQHGLSPQPHAMTMGDAGSAEVRLRFAFVSSLRTDM
jgi:hypothetical protein